MILFQTLRNCRVLNPQFNISLQLVLKIDQWFRGFQKSALKSLGQKSLRWFFLRQYKFKTRVRKLPFLREIYGANIFFADLSKGMKVLPLLATRNKMKRFCRPISPQITAVKTVKQKWDEKNSLNQSCPRLVGKVAWWGGGMGQLPLTSNPHPHPLPSK